ncbi:MAG: SDR family oxidoreductase [Pedobacter sp.]|nr:MAG: SDR family oxidoreductase [Pedobacter sp.]
MKIDLTSKNALVGASTQGIGYGISMELAKCGANVTLMARNEAKLKETLAQLPIVSKQQVHGYIVADFSDFENYRKVIDDFFSKNSIAILVNNTSGPKAGMAQDLAVDSYQQAFDLVFKTVCETTLLAIPHMIERKFGRIINVSSISVKEPVNNLVLSNSIRAATAAWAKTLANELAAHQITVNTILTGFFDTERITSLIDNEAKLTGQSAAAIRERRENEIPMKRLGKPEEYGHLVAFLASDYAAYLTGASIPLDGGLTKNY